MIPVRCSLVCWLLLLTIPVVGRGQPPPYKPAANAAEAIKRIEEIGGSVRKAALEGDALEVDLRSTAATDEHLQYLLALKNVAVVRLRECRIGDAGLVHLGKIAVLKKLHLEKTQITDAGLKHLASLKELEVLNLFGCGIGDAGLNSLQPLPKLKSLFVTETKVTEAGITALRKTKPNLVVVPDRALEREQAEAAWETAKKALAEMDVRFQVAKKDAENLPPRVAELKKKMDEAAKKLNETKSKGGDVSGAQAALKAAQQQHSQAANAAKNFEIAQKHLAAYRQLEADTRSRVEALRTK
ncbi:MAG: hypothetical protein FJ303_08430 [Planctomycetes bacterium]|nr:hypothetical protein [Planctomycetota bacterium]